MIIDATFLMVVSGVSLLGGLSGALGCFAFLKRQSLLADAISHAALPGIALMFLMTHTNNPVLLLFGGMIAGLCGTLLVELIIAQTTLKKDTALGFVLSVFFGFGLVLLTVIQKKSVAQQAILNKFLFGNAATLLIADLQLILIIALIVLFFITLFWKEFTALIFDPIFCKSIHWHTTFLHIFLTILLVTAIVVGLQTVGVILMSSMFIAPSAAARQWVNDFFAMVLLAGLLGSFSSIIGVIISCSYNNMPTGPMIVIVVSGAVLISVFFAPQRGIIWQFVRKKWKKVNS